MYLPLAKVQSLSWRYVDRSLYSMNILVRISFLPILLEPDIQV